MSTRSKETGVSCSEAPCSGACATSRSSKVLGFSAWGDGAAALTGSASESARREAAGGATWEASRPETGAETGATTLAPDQGDGDL